MAYLVAVPMAWLTYMIIAISVGRDSEAIFGEVFTPVALYGIFFAIFSILPSYFSKPPHFLSFIGVCCIAAQVPVLLAFMGEPSSSYLSVGFAGFEFAFIVSGIISGGTFWFIKYGKIRKD